MLILLWACVAALLAYELHTSHQAEWRQAEAESGNLVRLLERQISATVQKLDLLLQDVVEDTSTAVSGASAMPNVSKTNIWLRSVQARVPESVEGTLRVVGANGNTLFQAGTDASLPLANISDRSYFQRLRDDPQAGLVMSEPLLSRFVKDAWLLTLSRRLAAPDDRFVGLAMVSLPVADLQASLEHLDLGAHGSVALYDGQLRLIAREPMGQAVRGQAYALNEVSAALAAGQTEGSYITRSRVDGTERQYVFGKISQPDIVVLVGRAPVDFLSRWQQKQTIFVVALSVVLLLIGALLMQLHRLDRIAREHVDFILTHDMLTRLPNRLSLETLSGASRPEKLPDAYALLVLDIDKFRSINDGLGYDAGDQLLRLCAQRLSTSLPTGGRLWRHGGDEFVLMLPGGWTDERAAAAAEAVLATLAAPMCLAQQEIEISASIGVALRPQHGSELPDLLHAAEAALFAVKSAGRAGHFIFSDKMRSAMSERMSLEQNLRKAVARDQMRLYYQPQFNLADGRLTGFEALIRWQHPELGLVTPGAFIPLAEETGMIVAIGEWVMDAACRQAKLWHASGRPAVPIAVNLAARQFRRSDLVKEISDCLVRHGLAPGMLALEVTESSLMLDIEQVIATLQHLKALGLSIAIDDFGTGYSSLSYLKQFPIDKIKIDQSFVRGMMTSSGDNAIVQAVIAIASRMGLHTVAEGVESAEHVAHLRQLGCDEGQGYYYGKPAPAADAERFL